MAHNIDKQLDVNLPKETDLAIKLVAALTGENPSKFIHMSEDELFQYLAYLMKCEKEKILELFREHDQNEALDLIELARLWKLNSKNVVKGRSCPFGKTPKEFFDKILFLMGQRADAVRMLTENCVGSAVTSEIMTNFKFSISMKDRRAIQYPSTSNHVKSVGSSNDNSSSGRTF